MWEPRVVLLYPPALLSSSVKWGSLFAPGPFWVENPHLSGKHISRGEPRRMECTCWELPGATGNLQVLPGPPREKRLWKSGCDGAPSAGRRRKCLLDRLSRILLVQRHRFWIDPLNSHNTPGLGGTTTQQRKVLGQIRKETTACGLVVKQSCVQTPAPSLCAPGSVTRSL